ncbi:MAG: short-chain fatty acyl-CoA regulator family protein [Pseudomonadota bacterium]
MVDAILGTRIRERRRRSGITQSDLARTIGISASYLNLIERNKRRIAGPLLARIASALDTDIGDLDGASEQRLAENLNEIAHLPALEALEIETDQVGELLGRYPGWARALAALARSEHDANRTARSLADRLAHDPFLAETVHRMLSRVAAVRPSAEILTDYDDIEPTQRDRFLRIIRDETEALTDIGEALATYFEKSDAEDRNLTPIDEVEALFELQSNRFPELEAATRELSCLVDQRAPLPRPVAANAIAREHLHGAIEDLARNGKPIETSAARSRATSLLTDYACRALQLPMERFLADAVERQFDIELLAKHYRTEIKTICQRLTALPETIPDAEDMRLPRFGYFQANASGTITEMLGLPGLALPRYASACPLWALYRAQQTPESVLYQRAVFPNGDRFVFVALASRAGDTGFNRPRHFLTDMIAMREADAMKTVYAPNDSTPIEEVGPACRLCPRTDCIHRADDPLSG